MNVFEAGRTTPEDEVGPLSGQATTLLQGA